MRTFFKIFWVTVLVCLLSTTVQAGPRKNYQRGVSAFKSLLVDEKRAGLRDEWFKVAAFFEKSLAADAKGEEAPKCMYFLGRCYEELGKRSFLKFDREKALEAFDRMLIAFPKHGWADDSLYRKGLIMLEQIKDREAARKIFEEVVSRYPKGDMVPEAKKHLAVLNASRKDAPTRATAKTSKPAAEKEAAKQTPPAAKKGAVLTGIRHWSGQEYTRVVLDLTRDVRYERKLAEQGSGRQLQISLPGTSVGPDVMRVRTIGDGVLEKIRVGEGGGRVLVTVDLMQMGDYRVFALPDPCRVVIDFHSSPDGQTQSSATAEASQENHVQAALQELQREQAAPAVKEPAPKTISKTQTPPSEEKKATTSPDPKQPAFVPSAKQKKYSGSLMEQLGLKVRTIMLDPGHGGKDPGAVGHGVREKDVNLRVAKIMGKMLQDQGFTVHYTRTTDKFIPLEERTAMANAKAADLFISIHCNAYKDARIRGFEIYYLNLATDAQAVRVAARENGVSAKKISDMQFILSDLMLNSKINESRQMASLVEKETLKKVRTQYKISSHGTKGAFFYVLTGARMPSILVEMGYLTNKQDAALLKSDKYLTLMAQGLVNGVIAYKKKLERHTD